MALGIVLTKEEYEQIADLLGKEIQKLGHKQLVANAIGFHYSYVHALSKRGIKRMTIDTRKKLNKYFGIKLNTEKPKHYSYHSYHEVTLNGLIKEFPQMKTLPVKVQDIILQEFLVGEDQGKFFVDCKTTEDVAAIRSSIRQVNASSGDGYVLHLGGF